MATTLVPILRGGARWVRRRKGIFVRRQPLGWDCRVDEAAEEEVLDRSQHGESAYAFGEGVRASLQVPFDPDAGLARLREQFVLETTRRAVQALKAPDPLD